MRIMRHKRVEKKDYLRNRCLIQQTLKENYLFYLQYRDVFTIYHDNTCFFFHSVPQIPVCSKFKFPRTISQKAPIDPRWNCSLYGCRDGVGGFLCRMDQRRQALESTGLWTSLPTGY